MLSGRPRPPNPPLLPLPFSTNKLRVQQNRRSNNPPEKSNLKKNEKYQSNTFLRASLAIGRTTAQRLGE